MRLSFADYTWPLLDHADALALGRALGCTGVDLGFMTDRSHVRPERLGDDIATVAAEVRERVESGGLVVADVFAIPATDFETRALNNPDATERDRSWEFFERAVRFAAAVGAPGVTTLPGVAFASESREASMHRSATELRRRVEHAAAAELELSVEPHTGSLIDTPDRTRQLLDAVPGLRLTLDHGHFVRGGVEQPEIDALLPYARHLQCRPARPGVLQARVAEDAIDWTQVVQLQHERGYAGWYGLEFVWQDWLDCNRVDTVAESALLRDVLLAAEPA